MQELKSGRALVMFQRGNISRRVGAGFRGDAAPECHHGTLTVCVCSISPDEAIPGADDVDRIIIRDVPHGDFGTRVIIIHCQGSDWSMPAASDGWPCYRVTVGYGNLEQAQQHHGAEFMAALWAISKRWGEEPFALLRWLTGAPIAVA